MYYREADACLSLAQFSWEAIFLAPVKGAIKSARYAIPRGALLI